MIDTTLIKGRLLYSALQGKLVEQKTTDESASKMVSRVSKELNAVDFKADYDDSEIPFDIPDNWCWCRLSDIGRTNIGLTYHPEDIANYGTIVVRSSNIINGKMDYNDIVQVNCSIRDNQYLDNNDIVICARNGSRALVGKCAVYEGDSRTVAFGAFMAVFRTKFFKYVYYYLQTPVFRRYFSNDDTKQINQVTQSILKNALIPLPPYEEQIRIVDRVEEILAVLDNIDSLQSQYATNAEILKSKLIDAGIRGELTEQLPEDGDAENLYNQIQDEKARLIKEGKIKKEKPLPDISEDEIPFGIPKNWKWVRLGELSNSIQYGYNAPAKSEGSIKMVRISDIHDNEVDWESVPYCDIEDNEVESYQLKENDILFARTGGTVGKSYIVQDIPEKAVFAGYLIRSSYSIKLYPKYMKFFMESSLYWKQLYNGTIATAQPNCNGKTLSKMMLPLPPAKEQKRIVERLEALMEQL